ncbi:YihY/virulence factor BrkB family protein [Pseudodonghicola flavimaris]|uniref:YihY/virulence factor BrkB family protein n=1 Tax=Pseudodonghicola flavimaris TaxID=3050036 RepID=A0ABT7F1H2_9RHOB|nr:YihY/virulence factor BrkB family protein [Pseudodonghicola flavimaris]MDK3018314.1 YihY/virulence factor BrkB family protein [Pseudodonghicola flavimaris]
MSIETTSTPLTLPRLLRGLRRAASRFGEKGGWVMSSHVAMSLMMALFPFVLFIVALAGALSRDVPTDDLFDLLLGSWPEQVAAPIERELRAVLQSSHSSLMTVGGVLALYFASNGVEAVRFALSRAYHDADPRPFWMTRLISLGLVIAGAAMVLLAVAVDLVLPIYTNILNAAVPGQVTSWFTGIGVSWLFIAATPVLAIFAFHLILPPRRHRLRLLLPGILLTVVLGALAGWGFSVYVSRFASYSATYAGLAGAMSALIFLYLNAAILIFGAEFNGALMEQEEGPQPQEPLAPVAPDV